MSESLRFDREEVVFKSKGSANRLFSKLILKNTSENFIGYQIKGNNVKRYIISKPLGKIEPFTTTEINIEMTLNDRELEKIESISDKFCCFYMYIDEEHADKTESELESILKTKQRNKTIHRLKVKSRVAKNENEEEKKETPVFDEIQLNQGESEEIETEEIKMGNPMRQTVYSGGFRKTENNERLKDSMDVEMEMEKIRGNIQKVKEKTQAISHKNDFEIKQETPKPDPRPLSNSVNLKKPVEIVEKKIQLIKKKVVNKTPKKEIVQVFQKCKFNFRNLTEFSLKQNILRN